MAAAAWDGLVLSKQGKRSLRVLLHAEACWPKTMLVVARCAIARSECSAVSIAVAVAAALEAQLPVPLRRRELRRMATSTRHFAMQSFEREGGLWMCAKSDLSGEPQPANTRMATLASLTKWSLVHRRMARHTCRSRTRRIDVALVVASLALRLCMTRGEAEPRVIASNVANPLPIALVVA